MTMKRLLTAVGVLAAAGVLAIAAGGSASFTDPAGDSGAAADITSLAVTDNASTGSVTVSLTATGFASAITDNSMRVVGVFLDTDRNPATGSPSGAEYNLGAGRDAGSGGWWIEHWNGSDFVDMAQSPTMGYTRSGDSISWTFATSDIGGAAGFGIAALSVTVDANGTLIGSDRAPDGGTWNYTLSAPAPAPAPVPAAPTTTTPATTTPLTPAPAVKPVIGKPVTTPAKPVAGMRFTVMFPVTRSDTSAPLTTGKMVCDPSVNGTVIKHAESFKAGKAQLSFVIPKTTKGKALKVKVTINVGTQSTTRIATFRIG